MSDKGTVVPFFATLDGLVSRGMGLDMALKASLGLFRLMAMYSSNVEFKEGCADVAMSIINCRMLANHFRHIMSLSVMVELVKKRDKTSYTWVFQAASFFFRSFGQLFGDLGYYQMVFMRHWSRSRLTFGYRFFKSLSLTFGLLDELTTLRRVISKNDAGRMGAVRASLVSIARYMCDIVVYYQWLPWYNPALWLQYACGSTGGFLGLYVMWKETRARLEAAQASPPNLLVPPKTASKPKSTASPTAATEAETKARITGTTVTEVVKPEHAVVGKKNKKASGDQNNINGDDRSVNCDGDLNCVHERYRTTNGRVSNVDSSSFNVPQKEQVKVDE